MFSTSFVRRCISILGVFTPLSLGYAAHAAGTQTAQRAAAQARAASLAGATSPNRYLPLVTQQRMAQQAEKTHPATTAKSATATSSHRSLAMSPGDRFFQSLKQKLAANAKTANASALPAAATSSAMAGNLAVNFPGFRQAATAAGGYPNDYYYGLTSFTADVNKDGKPDVITVNNDGTVNVLLNPGTGSLSTFKISSTNLAAQSYGVTFVAGTVVDLNNDGYPDLELTDIVNNAEFIYINKQNGTFAAPVMTAFSFTNGEPFNGAGGSVVFADVNGDKVPDMIATITTPSSSPISSTISIQVALGKGDGTFAAPLAEQDATINAYLSSSYAQVVTADVNNDGKQDLVYLTGGYDSSYNNVGYVFPVLGKGDGTFTAPPTTLPTTGAIVSGPYVQSNASLAVADINGDGFVDFLFNLGDGNLYTALGTGTATPQKVQTALTGLSTLEILGPGLVNFADVNGDGIPDAIAYNYGFIAVYAGTKTGTFTPTPLGQYVSGDSAYQQPLPADFNGDGQVDLLQVDYNSLTVGFYPGGNWAAAGAPAMAATGETAQSLQVLSTGDFNGDGYPDVLATDFNGVPVYDPFGGFAVPAANLTSDAELQQDETQPNLVIGTNDGKGNFTYKTAITSAIGMSKALDWVSPVSVDLNGDGKADIVSGAVQGIAVSLSTATGTYSTPVAVTLSLPTRCTISAVDIGDLNGDGYPDMVATYPGDSSCGYTYNAVPTPSGFFIMINNKSGGFTSTFVRYGFGVDLPKLADMNGDGKLDLLLADTGTGGLGYYFYAIPGNGDGTFNLAGATIPLEATVVTSIVPGDFDGDGKMDLALGVLTQVDANGEPVYNTTGEAILKGNGDLTFGLPVQYAPGTYAVDGKVADFNGDGRPDLALNMESYVYYTDIPTSNFVYMPNTGSGGFGSPIQGFGPAAPGNTFVADFNGDGAIDVISGGLDQLVSGVTGLYLNLGGVSLSLKSSATTVSQNGSVTLTASLTAVLNTATPTGTVTLYDNGSILGIVPVSSTSTVLTTTLTTTGANSIKAVYSGDGNYNGATSSPVAITVSAVTPTFTLSAPSGTVSVTQGQTGVVSMTVTANSAFTGTVSLSCTGAPSESSCTLNPASITLAAGQSATLSVVIATTAPNNTSEALNHKPAGLFPGAMEAASLAGVAMFLGLRRRKGFLAATGLCVLALVGLAASLSLTGCSSSGSSTSSPTYKYTGTPVGSSTITVTATSGSVTQSQAVTITVAN